MRRGIVGVRPGAHMDAVRALVRVRPACTLCERVRGRVMKIDKRRPAHWLLLCGFFVAGLAGLVLRLARPRVARKRVVFYGHKLNGNLLAIQRQLAGAADDELVPVFLTMDRAYAGRLRANGVRSAWACGPAAAGLLAGASALVSDHGLHSLGLLMRAYRRLGLHFFDVWHGIPFKGFDAGDFRLQHRYDGVWVASPLMQKLYVDRYGFDPRKVRATGYARTDRLVRQDEDAAAIKHDLALDAPDLGKLIVFAPTWQQDAQQRSIYPFGTDEVTFLGALSRLAQRTGSTIVMRTHLNSGAVASSAWDRIVQRPFADYPDTEALLLASDILICDWSSIAFDWLLLDRPTIFLDVEPPFAKGFSLGADYRFGAVVGSTDELLQRLEQYVSDPQAYQRTHGARQAGIRHHVYGACADGRAARRCIRQLRAATRGRADDG